jgi:hypothetical protein
MARLPQEVVDQICSYLGPPELANASYVSTTFRTAAEDQAENHRHHKLAVVGEEKPTWLEQYSGFTLRYIEEIEFDPIFPDLKMENLLYPNKLFSCRESAQEQKEKDRIFTEQVRGFLVALKTMEERAGERNMGNYRLTINSPTQQIWGCPCQHRIRSWWRNHLLEPDSLPTVLSVATLRVLNDNASYGELDRYKQPFMVPAKLDYRILVDLIRCFPRLKKLECHVGIDEWTPAYREEPTIWEYAGPRQDTRHGFGEAISSKSLPASLREMTLDFLCDDAMQHAEGIAHWTSMPNLVQPALKDPFSTSLRILSCHLRSLTLRAQVDDSLFWPENGSTPVWPHLQHLFIMFHIVSPGGTWYFEGPRGEGRDTPCYGVDESAYPELPELDLTKESDCSNGDWDEAGRSFEDTYLYYFRISPNNAVLRPFLASFAKAAAQMHDLRKAILWCPLRWDVDGGDDEEWNYERFADIDPPAPPGRDSEHSHSVDYLAWGLVYYVPCREAFGITAGGEDYDSRRIWWEVGQWRPDPQLHHLFQKIGHGRYGGEMKEYWSGQDTNAGYYFDFLREEFGYWTSGEWNS